MLGCHPLQGQQVQTVVPAFTCQAGYLLPGGRYALFGCTMAPALLPPGSKPASPGI